MAEERRNRSWPETSYWIFITRERSLSLSGITIFSTLVIPIINRRLGIGELGYASSAEMRIT